MKVFILKDVGGFLVNDIEYEVPSSPLDEEGVFLWPSVPYMKDAPPSVESNEIAVAENWDKKTPKWVKKPDFVGLNYWDKDGNIHTIESIGETVPKGASLDPPKESVTRLTAGQFRQQLIIDDKDELVLEVIANIEDEKKTETCIS